MSRATFLCLGIVGLGLVLAPSLAEAQPASNATMLRGQPLGSMPVHRARPNPRPIPITPPGRFVDAAVGGPFWFGAGRTVVVRSADVTVPREISFTLNRIPTVAGIARPPVAAPVIYVIGGDRRQGRVERRGEMRRMAQADTTTPRIIHVPRR